LNAASKYETYLDLRVTCPLFLPDINQIWNFSTNLNKSFQQQISRTGGRVKTLIGAFSEYVNAPKKMREEVTVPPSVLFQQKRNLLFGQIGHFGVRGGVVNH
jgi:hypothetical protein